MKTYLYRYYDKRKKLLYVGITNDFKRRDSEHKSKRWYKYATNVKLVKYKTRDKALQAEEKAIKSEKPICNKVYNKNMRFKEYKLDKYLTVIAVWLIAFLLLYLIAKVGE